MVESNSIIKDYNSIIKDYKAPSALGRYSLYVNWKK